MSYGLELINANGVSLVRDGEKVPTFSARYNVGIGSGSINTGISSNEVYCVPFTRGQMMCNVVPSEGYYVINYTAKTASSIYVYRAPSSSGGYGVQVFNSDGSLAYQNNSRALRILTLNPGYGATYSGKTLAILPRVINYNTVSAGGGQYYTYIRVSCINPGSPDTVGMFVQQTIPAPVEVFIYGGVIPVIDVTGL